MFKQNPDRSLIEENALEHINVERSEETECKPTHTHKHPHRHIHTHTNKHAHTHTHTHKHPNTQSTIPCLALIVSGCRHCIDLL